MPAYFSVRRIGLCRPQAATNLTVWRVTGLKAFVGWLNGPFHSNYSVDVDHNARGLRCDRTRISCKEFKRLYIVLPFPHF